MKWSTEDAKKFMNMVKEINKECIITVGDGKLSTKVIDVSNIAVVDTYVPVVDCAEGCRVGVDVGKLFTALNSINTKEATIEMGEGEMFITGGKKEYRFPLFIGAKESRVPKAPWPFQAVLSGKEFYDAIDSIGKVVDAKDSSSAIEFKWNGKELRISDGEVLNVIFDENDLSGTLPEEKLYSKFALDFIKIFAKQGATSDEVTLLLGDSTPMGYRVTGDGWKADYVLAPRIVDGK